MHVFPVEILKDKISKSDLLTEPYILLPALPQHLFSYSSELIGEAFEKSVTVKSFNSIEEFESFAEGTTVSTDLEGVFVAMGKSFDAEDLTGLGYERVERVWQPGEFSLHGDVVIVWQEGHSNPVRISLLGKNVDQIEIVDSVSRKSIAERNKIRVDPMDRAISELEVAKEDGGDNDDGEAKSSPKERVVPIQTVVGNEDSDESLSAQFIYIKGLSGIEADQLNVPFIDLGLRSIPMANSQYSHVPSLVALIKKYMSEGYQVKYLAPGHDAFNSINEELKALLKFQNIGQISHLVSKGFVSTKSREVYLTNYEIYGEVNLADSEVTGSKSKGFLSQKRDVLLRQEIFKKIKPGDYIVHEDHGVGKYMGIVEKLQGDYIEVAYAESDKLFVPLYQASKVTKYIGSKKPALTTLSGGMWRRIRRIADENAEELAKELIQIYAMRRMASGDKGLSSGIKLDRVDRFIKSFQYSDTEDQIVATEQVISDLTSGVPMDRLLVGDVGFGKTEIALRAMFAVAEAGYQVAFLAPTTILVEQHAALMRKRFDQFGIKVATLSRFLTAQEQRESIKRVNAGEVDILVGTHAILTETLKFKNLGLIVVDEEQKFGVKQKEKLKSHRVDTHVLSLTATPIPRTLSMSLSGLKDISIIATPPPGRKPIGNSFAIFNWDSIKKALSKELERAGQAYFLHNRVKNITFYKNRISKMFPGKVVEVAHGQMEPADLAFIMGAFAAGEIDILVCTSIIENGIDLQNVNTLVVNDANMFGLSQLYQIRGRVGRSDRQAYAYFLYKTLPGRAGQRLDALADSDELGAGFMLANRDLEIRGAGNLLGREQSGAINSVGYGMYINLLEQKIEEFSS